MWILFAFGSALFAGLTAILAKCGIRNTDSKCCDSIKNRCSVSFFHGLWYLWSGHKAESEIFQQKS